MKKIISLFQRNYDGDRLVRMKSFLAPSGSSRARSGNAKVRWRLLHGARRETLQAVRRQGWQDPPAGFEPAQDRMKPPDTFPAGSGGRGAGGPLVPGGAQD